MLTLPPPHSSQKLQPLDLTGFGPLKAYYLQAEDSWIRNNPGKTFDIMWLVYYWANHFQKHSQHPMLSMDLENVDFTHIIRKYLPIATTIAAVLQIIQVLLLPQKRLNNSLSLQAVML